MRAYTSGPHVFVCEGGVTQVVELRCPTGGTIVTLKFDQVDGVAAGCVFEAYTRAAAVIPPSPPPADPIPPASAYSVFGSKTYVADTPFLETDQTYNYANKDAGPTNRKRKLYLRVTPSGTGTKSYVITMEMELATL